MHDTDDDPYMWPTCTACCRDLWVDEAEAGRLACRPCENRTAKRLAELSALFSRLNETATLMRGARRPGSAASGSRVPPIPPRIEVLALTGPGGVAARLVAIEDSWRQALGRRIGTWAGSPAQAVPVHVNFLIINLERACEKYESIANDIDEIRRVHAEVTAALSIDQRPGPVQIGRCPARLDTGPCGQPLTASIASPLVHCPNCRSEWDGYAAWRDLRLAQEAVLRQDAGIAA